MHFKPRHGVCFLALVVATNGSWAQAQPEPQLDWHDAMAGEIEGRAFGEQPRERWGDRLPVSARGEVTDLVWDRSRDSAGMMVRFRTDAAAIWADYSLVKARLAGPNMTAIGSSGLDLYARDDHGTWRWVGVTRPDAQRVRQVILGGLAPGLREYALYLPLHNTPETLQVGVSAGAQFEFLAPRAERPIVFYGTSINHGASASRPGMVHTALLGRRLDRPVYNFGFGGNGRMDLEVAQYLVQIDAAVYVIDCLPNMNAAMVRGKCPPLVRYLRQHRPETPILLVEDRRFTNAWITPAKQTFHDENHAALAECFNALLAEGVSDLHYLKGDDLLGDDSEGATDGSHPNDLGFFRQAAQFEPVLRGLLAGR